MPTPKEIREDIEAFNATLAPLIAQREALAREVQALYANVRNQGWDILGILKKTAPRPQNGDAGYIVTATGLHTAVHDTLTRLFLEACGVADEPEAKGWTPSGADITELAELAPDMFIILLDRSERSIISPVSEATGYADRIEYQGIYMPHDGNYRRDPSYRFPDGLPPNHRELAELPWRSIDFERTRETGKPSYSEAARPEWVLMLRAASTWWALGERDRLLEEIDALTVKIQKLQRKIAMLEASLLEDDPGEEVTAPSPSPSPAMQPTDWRYGEFSDAIEGACRELNILDMGLAANDPDTLKLIVEKIRSTHPGRRISDSSLKTKLRSWSRPPWR